MAEAGNEPSLSGEYSFAKLERILATAAEVSSLGMAGRRRKEEVRSSEVHLRLTTWFTALPDHAEAERLARVVVCGRELLPGHVLRWLRGSHKLVVCPKGG